MHVAVANTEEMVEGLAKRRFDLAIISLPVVDDRLTITPLFKEELLVLQHSERPLQGWRVGNVERAELSKQPFLLYPPESNMRKMIDRHFAELGIVPRVAIEAADTEVLVRMVEAGFGQGILPENALRRSPRYYRVMRIENRRLLREQALAALSISRSRPLTVEISKFLQASLR